jgi:hypothetical protein
MGARPMIQFIKCLFGFHEWLIADEIDVPSTPTTVHPSDFRAGGTDYVLCCAHCPAERIEERRGEAWPALPYPNFSHAE